MLAGYCCCWIVLIFFNFQTVSFSAGAPVTSIIEMAISYNYEYLAMFTDTGLLWIGSADLQVGITLSHLFSPQIQLSEDEFEQLALSWLGFLENKNEWRSNSTGSTSFDSIIFIKVWRKHVKRICLYYLNLRYLFLWQMKTCKIKIVVSALVLHGSTGSTSFDSIPRFEEGV